MVAGTVLPRVPVADEQAIVKTAAGLPLRLRLERGRGFRRGLARKDGHGQHEVPPARGHLERIHVEGQARHRLRLAPLQAQAEHLRRAGAGGDEEQAPAVRRPTGLGVVGLVAGQPPGPSPPGGSDPEVVPALVRLEVGHPDREGHGQTVGGHPGVGDAVHGQHVVNGERVGVGRRGGAGQERGQKHREASAHANLPPAPPAGDAHLTRDG